MKHDWTTGEAYGKGTAAVLGGFAAFILFGLMLGTALPALGLPIGVAVALSAGLSIPVWTLFIGWAVLAPSGRGAWFRVGGTTLVLGVITVLAYFL
ncbi:MAG: hypothetical protein GVY18_15855 [Bacteroidetes bacterium]|jgi:hypothetical protein|nr:hypothetical protein [Bacteroidota bacterium]